MNTNGMKNAIIIAVALVVSVLLYHILPYEPVTNKGLALLVFIGTLWLTEAVHITVTALLVPVIAILLGLENTPTALRAFANPTIFLFFGGFALSTALNVQGLDRYIANKVILLSRGSFLGAVLLLFLVTALMSMGISNTATAAMMLPLGIGLLKKLPFEENKGTYAFVVLGVAYSASIGGMGTLVGSPPNAIVASQLNLTFSQWLQYGMPAMFGMLPLMLVAVFIIFRPKFNIPITVEVQNEKLTTKQYLTIGVFVFTALSWIFGQYINPWLSEFLGIGVIKDFDSLVAIGAATLVCGLNLASWKQVQENTDWGVLMLFGGGLTLSAMLISSGASKAMVEALVFMVEGKHFFLIGLLVATFIIFLTEFTSNTAASALLVPIFISIAQELQMNPLGLALIIGLGASCAFMMPVATPPNAIAYGTGKVAQQDMIRAGFILNVVSIMFISTIAYYLWF